MRSRAGHRGTVYAISDGRYSSKRPGERLGVTYGPLCFESQRNERTLAYAAPPLDNRTASRSDIKRAVLFVEQCVCHRHRPRLFGPLERCSRTLAVGDRAAQNARAANRERLFITLTALAHQCSLRGILSIGGRVSY